MSWETRFDFGSPFSTGFGRRALALVVVVVRVRRMELYGELTEVRSRTCAANALRVSRMRVDSLVAHACAALWASLSRGAPRRRAGRAVLGGFADFAPGKFRSWRFRGRACRVAGV